MIRPINQPIVCATCFCVGACVPPVIAVGRVRQGSRLHAAQSQHASSTAGPLWDTVSTTRYIKERESAPRSPSSPILGACPEPVLANQSFVAKTGNHKRSALMKAAGGGGGCFVQGFVANYVESQGADVVRQFRRTQLLEPLKRVLHI